MDWNKNIEFVYDDFKGSKNPDGTVNLPNANLVQMKSDCLYHLALSTEANDFPAMFGDVKFVCMGGTVNRMQQFAEMVGNELNIPGPFVDLTKESQRFSMFKVGPVLSVSHGMGVSSFSILLHEVIKLVYYAKCKNVVFFRIGTCGGVNVPKGTVVITDKAVDELLRPIYQLNIMNKVVQRPTNCDKDLINELKEIADQSSNDYQTVLGTTMCAMDFYEAQSRLDGAFCNFTQADKLNRLNQLKEAGVVNIEMESTVFTSMCHYAGIPGAIVSVTLVNRLDGDQVNHAKEFSQQLQKRPQELVLKFIKKRLSNESNHHPN